MGWILRSSAKNPRHVLGAIACAASSLSAATPALAVPAAETITGNVFDSAPPAVRAMTLEEALDFARAHQPLVRAAKARVMAAQADASATRAQWRPFAVAGAELLGGSSHNTTASYLSIPGLETPRIGSTRIRNTNLTNIYASTFAAVSLDQEIFDFGRIAAQAAIDDFIAAAETERTDSELLQIALDVEETFFAVKAAHQVLLASEDAYRRAQAHRDEADAAVSRGVRAPIELTRAEADLARFEVGRIRAQGGLLSAQSAFAAAVAVPEPGLDAKGEAPPPAKLPSLRTALDQAAAKNPELKEAITRLRVQEAVTAAIGALLRPNLALTASFSAREGGAPATNGEVHRFDGWIPETPNWDIGLILRWPFYDGVVLARQEASVQREELQKAEIDVVRERQNAAIQRAWVSATVADRAIGALDRAAEAAKANYAQADTRFRAGLGTSVEVADAAAVRTDAEIQLAIGRFDLARARALMARLIAEGL